MVFSTAAGRDRRGTIHLIVVGCLTLLLTATGPAAANATTTGTPYAINLPAVSNNALVLPSGVASPFGVVVAGNASQALSALGLTWWYAFGQSSPSTVGQGVAQIALRPDGVNLSQIPLATLQSEARQYPGSYWIIGNEPNVPGQDDVSGDYYATQFNYYYQSIKGTDPTAHLVGPNALNWDFTCSGCGGFTSGHTWVDGFRAAWASQYGGEPPIDVWSLHAYSITWDKLPMTDAPLVEAQISGFATYLAGIPADQNKEIWLTETGVIWGYDGWTVATSGCAQAPNCTAPVGAFDTTAVTSYLNALLPWLASNSSQYRLGRWFLYTTAGSPEPYATAYAGISLLDGAGLSSFGQIYRQAALPQAP